MWHPFSPSSEKSLPDVFEYCVYYFYCLRNPDKLRGVVGLALESLCLRAKALKGFGALPHGDWHYERTCRRSLLPA